MSYLLPFFFFSSSSGVVVGGGACYYHTCISSFPRPYLRVILVE